MRAVVQRVIHAEVTVGSRHVGSIDNGFVVLLGVHRDDTASDVAWMTDKLINLRIFEDNEGRMNRSIQDTGGAMLIVSQFTLLGDCRRGRRPSWSSAARPAKARSLYEDVVAAVAESGIPVETGEFQVMMDVHLTNSGPVTLLLDSQKNF